MRTVVGLSDKLAKTMLIGASPNERPVNVSSPRVNVQATRSLKAPDMPAEAEAGGSKVFLPSSLLSVGSSNTSTVPRPEVDLILHVFQFPSTPNPIEPLPKGSAPNGTKIIPRQRLANSSAFVTFNITGRAGNIINPTAVGRRLGVHDLVSDPMMISLVLDEMGIEAMRNESRVAACTIWNSTSMQYADNACIALPNPRPTGIHARFRTGSSSGALALRNVAQKSIAFSASMAETRGRVLSLHRDFLRSVPWIKRTYKVPMTEEKMRSMLTSAFKEKAAEADMNQVNRLIIKGRMELEETMMLWKGDSHVIGWLETQAEKRAAAAKTKSKTVFLDNFFA